MTASLLGVFGVVAFAGGLTTLDKLSSPFNSIARLITTVAVFTGATSTVLLSMSAGGLGFKKVRSLNGPSLKKLMAEQTKEQARLLLWGRGAATITAGLVLVGSLLILWFGEAPPGAPSRFLVVHGENAVCGELSASDGGDLMIGDWLLANGTETITPVEECPEE